MSEKENIDQMAQGHWIYTKNVIVKSSFYSWNDKHLDLMGYLYIEAFKHGYKHAYDTAFIIGFNEALET